MKPNPSHARRRPLLLAVAGGSVLLLLGGFVLHHQLTGGTDGEIPLTVPSARPEPADRPSEGEPISPKGELAAQREITLLAQAAPPAGAPAPLDIRESFDRTQPNALPAGWSRWSNDTAATVGASATRSQSAPNGLAITGATNAVLRVWLNTPVIADAQASAMVYLDTLIPAQVLVRGANLNTATPSYYAASVSRGLDIQLIRVVRGSSTTLGTLRSANYISGKWVRVTMSASGNNLRVQVYRPDTSQYLSAAGQWQAAATWALTVTDNQVPAAGQLGLAKGASVSGTFTFDDFAAQPPTATDPPPVGPPPPPPVVQPVPRPTIPRHYDHIRIAMLAYVGTPFGAFEEQLCRSSVDLVIPNTGLLDRIKRIAPNTPQLLYSNTSSLYLELLTDWLAYADRRGLPREAAFFHTARPSPFRGDSASSRPVNMFWGVYRGGQTLTNVTSLAASGTGRINFGAAGEFVYVGYPDRFREMNVRLASGAGGGWSAALEYPTAVDGSGAPTQWSALTTLTDSTTRLTQTGLIIFDPPANWKPAVVSGSAPLYYVRFRTTAGGTAPAAITILGRDYVEANGTKSGTVPVFDTQADTNRDGYLNDQEYPRRAPGKDARFLYESRMMTEGYGQMRPATNPANAAFREWAVDYHVRMMGRHTLANGIFMDNVGGKPSIKVENVLEPVDTYARDSGAMLTAIWRAIAPRWVLANTGGAGERADPILQQSPAYFEEYGIRPMSHNWAFFEELATTVRRRATLANPAPIAVLDSHPQRSSVTDPRMQMGALAYYYLLADPDTTFFLLCGGFEPASAWSRHWISAISFNIGRPSGNWSQRATGPDPSNPVLSYRLYQRDYERALVLFKPLSHVRGQTITASNGDETATSHDLGGRFRLLRADGSTGEPITSISLRNGEGAILIRVQP